MRDPRSPAGCRQSAAAPHTTQSFQVREEHTLTVLRRSVARHSKSLSLPLTFLIYPYLTHVNCHYVAGSYRFLLEEPFLYSSPWNIHINQLMESERTLDKRKNMFSKRHSVSGCSSRSRTAPCRLAQVALRLWRHYSLKASAFLGSAVKFPGQHSLNWLIILFKSKSKVCFMLPVG